MKSYKEILKLTSFKVIAGVTSCVIVGGGIALSVNSKNNKTNPTDIAENYQGSKAYNNDVEEVKEEDIIDNGTKEVLEEKELETKKNKDKEIGVEDTNNGNNTEKPKPQNPDITTDNSNVQTPPTVDNKPVETPKPAPSKPSGIDYDLTNQINVANDNAMAIDFENVDQQYLKQQFYNIHLGKPVEVRELTLRNSPSVGTFKYQGKYKVEKRTSPNGYRPSFGYDKTGKESECYRVIAWYNSDTQSYDYYYYCIVYSAY